MKILRYRILTCTDGSGKVHYEVERKGWWVFWSKLMDGNWEYEGIARFSDRDDALKEIRLDAKQVRSRTSHVIEVEEVSI